MVNKESSTGYLEDLDEAIIECELLVKHFRKILRRVGLPADEKIAAKTFKDQYLSMRRQLMSVWKQITGEDYKKHWWCVQKHTRGVSGLLDEVADANPSLSSFADWAYRLKNQVVGVGSGLTLGECAACVFDELLAKGKDAGRNDSTN